MLSHEAMGILGDGGLVIVSSDDDDEATEEEEVNEEEEVQDKPTGSRSSFEELGCSHLVFRPYKELGDNRRWRLIHSL